MSGTATAAIRQFWEGLHEQPRFRPRYPHEQVVRWAFRALSPRGDRAATRVLDLGCGAGRHSVFLAEEGFQTFARDISRPGIEELQMRAMAKNLSIAATVADHLDDFPDNHFDAVLSFGVLYYMSYQKAVATVDAVLRILKPGGSFLCVLRSDQDGRMLGAMPTGQPFTWRLGQVDADGPSDVESGLEMLFFPEDGIQQLFSSFSAVVIDQMRFRHGRFADDDWVVQAEKPQPR